MLEMSAQTDNTAVQLYGTKDDMERWFLAHGVPHFMHHYSAASQVPVVALLLSIVLAFEVGAAPWLEVDTFGMILSPLILFVMTLIVLPWLRMIFEAGPWPTLSRLSWTLRATALGAASVLLLLSPLPPPDSVMWVNFALLVSVFAATTMLFSRRVWTSADRGHIRRRRVLLLAVVASVVLFHLEGHAFLRGLKVIVARSILGDLPILEPYAIRSGLRTCQPRPRTGVSLEGIKLFSRDIADSKVGKVHAAAVPLGICWKHRGRRQQSHSEDRQLKTKGRPVGCLQVAGVVPPLRAELFVSAEV